MVDNACKNCEEVFGDIAYESYVLERTQMLEELDEFELKNVWQEEIQSGVSTFATYQPQTVTSYTFPSTIRVKKSTDGEVYVIDFRDYCNVVLASEFGVGTDGKAYPHTEAIKVMSLCVRNFAWYRSLYPYNATEGYDVTDNTTTQAYKWSIAETVEEDYPRHVQIMDEMWNVMMFDGNKKLFIPSYLAGKYNASKSTGVISLVYQNGANYLAIEKGYTYKEILLYYYQADGYQISASPIIVCDSHVRNVEYYTTGLKHGQECQICGHIVMTSHSWVQSGTKYRCKIMFILSGRMF